MIGGEPNWQTIDERLRPFVARRVEGAADVDDIVQEVYLRMLRGLPSLRNQERLLPWMFTVARRAVVDHHRQVAVAPYLREELPEPPVEEPEPVDDDLRTALRLCARVWVDDLPPHYREAVTLVELEGLSVAEAAERLGLSSSGVKSRVQRGRAQLRKRFERVCHLALDGRSRVVECDPRVSSCACD